MKRWIVFLVVTAVSVLASFFTFVVIEKTRVIAVYKYQMDVSVKEGNLVGINANPNGLHFGIVPPNSIAQRELRIHQVEEDIFVKIMKNGKIAKWVSNSDRFIVRKGETKNITFSLYVPKDVFPGNYSGEAIVVLEKV